MKYAQLLREAWQITVAHPKLKWFAFIPSFIGVLIFTAEILWQLFMYLDEWNYLPFSIGTVFGAVYSFIVDHGLLLWVFVFFIFILIFLYVLPALVEGVLLFSMKQVVQNPENKFSLRQKMVQGGSVFFRFVELHAIMGLFSPWTILLFVATMYRYHHDTLFGFLGPVFLIFGIFSVFLTFFTLFANHFIVFEDCGVVDSLKRSAGLIFLNLGSTLAILFLILLINIRIVINALVVILVPFGLIWVLSSSWAIWIQSIGVILAIGLLALTSYLTAIVDVFFTAVWTKTFLVFCDKRNALEAEAESEES